MLVHSFRRWFLLLLLLLLVRLDLFRRNRSNGTAKEGIFGGVKRRWAAGFHIGGDIALKRGGIDKDGLHRLSASRSSIRMHSSATWRAKPTRARFVGCRLGRIGGGVSASASGLRNFRNGRLGLILSHACSKLVKLL